MKNLFRYYVLAGLTVVLAFAEGDVFAQEIWLPSDIRIQLYYVNNYHEKQIGTGLYGSYNDSGQRKDEWWINSSRAQGGLGPRFDKVERKGDSIYAICRLIGYLSYFSFDTISYSLNNITSTINNFTIRSGIDTSYISGADRISKNSLSFIHLTTMAYESSGDTLLTVSLGGIQTIKHFDSFTYDDYETNSYYWRADSYQNWLEYHSVDVDSLSFSCTIIFSKFFNSSVLDTKIAEEQFKVLNLFPNPRHRFSFPSASHFQTMLIYDILGREISKIEIPAGSTSYVLQSAGFPKGTYFARLGGSSAHFVIE